MNFGKVQCLYSRSYSSCWDEKGNSGVLSASFLYFWNYASPETAKSFLVLTALQVHQILSLAEMLEHEVKVTLASAGEAVKLALCTDFTMQGFSSDPVSEYLWISSRGYQVQQCFLVGQEKDTRECTDTISLACANSFIIFIATRWLRRQNFGFSTWFTSWLLHAFACDVK